MNNEPQPVLAIDDAHVWIHDGPHILKGVNWVVRPGEHWVLLGANGSGKTTLMALAATKRFPSQGTVSVLGSRLGHTDLWDLRQRIGVIDPAQTIYEWYTIEEIVMTGATNTVATQPGRDTSADRDRANDLLDLLGCTHLKGREIATCSQGERQRIRIARALMANPPLLLLDEPATGLDLLAREALLAALSSLARSQPDLATVLVSHHLEEIPASTTHALLLRDGRVIASGPAVQTLTTEHVTEAFGLPVTVRYDAGRFSARASATWQARA